MLVKFKHSLPATSSLLIFLYKNLMIFFDWRSRRGSLMEENQNVWGEKKRDETVTPFLFICCWRHVGAKESDGDVKVRRGEV